MSAPRSSHLVTFPRLRVNQLTKRFSAPGIPSIDCLTALVQTCTIKVSKLARLWPPNSHDPGMQVCMVIAMKFISSNTPDHGLHLYLQIRLITACKQLPSLHDHGLQVHLHTCLITVSKHIFKSAPSRPPRASPNSLDHSLLVYL